MRRAPRKKPPGFAEGSSHSYVVDFLIVDRGLSLNKSFVRIKDARVRRRIVDLGADAGCREECEA